MIIRIVIFIPRQVQPVSPFFITENALRERKYEKAITTQVHLIETRTILEYTETRLRGEKKT